MPRTVDRTGLLAAVRAVEVATAQRTGWIGIDGFGAAGKTRLAAWLAERVGRIAVVHVDDFGGPDVPEWDWPRFRAEVLVPLGEGRPAAFRTRDHTGAGGPYRLEPGRLIVVEGVSATRREAGVPWDLTVWVDAPDTVRLARVTERDGAALRERWLHDWIPSERAYAEREQPQRRVDLVVDGTAPEAQSHVDGATP
jgi:uridine kinase